MIRCVLFLSQILCVYVCLVPVTQLHFFFLTLFIMLFYFPDEGFLKNKRHQCIQHFWCFCLPVERGRGSRFLLNYVHICYALVKQGLFTLKDTQITVAIYIVLQVAEDGAAITGKGRRFSPFPPSSMSVFIFRTIFLRFYISDQTMILWSCHWTQFLSNPLSSHVPGTACSYGEDKGGLPFFFLKIFFFF